MAAVFLVQGRRICEDEGGAGAALLFGLLVGIAGAAILEPEADRVLGHGDAVGNFADFEVGGRRVIVI